jgi:hypothetical protein
VESRADGFGDPTQLIDQLSIVRVDDHGFVLETVTKDCRAANVLARKISLPVLLEPPGGIIVDVAWCGQDAGRLGAPLEEAG